MKQFKLLTIALLCLFVAMVIPVAAADFEITTVRVNDQLASNTIHVERGETITIEVWLKSTNASDDLRLKAWIGGYEHDDIEVKSDSFDMPAGVTMKKTLRLTLPDDMESADEADYNLHVEMYNDEEEFEFPSIHLYIDEGKHNLRLQDVIFTPGLSLEAGDLFFTVVRVENMGYEKEEDIMVKMSIPELGLSTRTYIEELGTVENDEDDDESSMSSDELFLRIPSNVKAGIYEVLIEVQYNRGHDVLEESYSLVVDGGVAYSDKEVSITVDTESQEVSQGAGAVYKVMFANIGSSKVDYILGVSGVESWGTFRVDPAKITLDEGETAEMFVYVTAKEGADLGEHNFVVNVKANGQNVKSFSLTADVVKDVNGWSQVRRGLEIGFAVLLIILVILGIVLAARKLGGNGNESMEEPTIEEGQTYY
ncbi:MAG: hypothetical protein KKH88_02735 [Nanoarchaeota archaeon]|nr:hypothetical protein [Nanoarchaeota archaeon]MBU1445388.1 hypothetical protein [Nanoarchaeota archaeon]MBU2406940.1 hypothetical protein [Nanoarchaeota archaeon]MBU2420161.1 hypothetical protein [Nanoarchaeota archaeon]MBU2475264.1 hypothetical protein [Nanoarchaeota archaeon]